jgi:hypothetical protein
MKAAHERLHGDTIALSEGVHLSPVQGFDRGLGYEAIECLVEIHHEQMNAVSFSAIGRGQFIDGVQIELIVLGCGDATGCGGDSGAEAPIGFVISKWKSQTRSSTIVRVTTCPGCAHGTTHLRTHVDIDLDSGLAQLEGGRWLLMNASQA